MIDERTKGANAASDAVPRRGPVYSDTFEFGPGRQWKFRLLDNLETIWAIAYAERMVLEQLREVFHDEQPEIVLTLLKEHSPNHDLQTFWTEILALQAALCREDGTAVWEGDAEDRARQLADELSPVERHQLAQMYEEFAEDKDPTGFTEDDLAKIIEAGKKNPGPFFWSRYGLNTLRRCVDILASDLASAMEKLEALDTD